MRIESSAFENGGVIPSKYTCDGENISPSLQFFDVPENTKSLMLICDDPDSPTGTWNHWSIWNIDPTISEIGERGVPEGAMQGITSFGGIGYGGPCPHGGMHRYFFRLYALDTVLDLPKGSAKNELLSAMEGHVIENAELMGVYERK